MKRHEFLKPMSRQHHNDLMGCLLLRKGLNKKTSPKVLKDFTLHFWISQLEPHIRKEEEKLLPYLVLHHFNEKQVNILKADLERIRIIMERISLSGDQSRLYELLTEQIISHIRFKERVVMNRMQENLEEEELEHLGKAMADENHKTCVDYKVRFWE